MKQKITTLIIISIIAISNLASAQNQPPASSALFKILAEKDSLLFDAVFNSCDIKKLEPMFSKDFVFYHDDGYKNPTSGQTRADFIKHLNDRCEQASKGEGQAMRRDIVKGSMQVFSANANEAMQLGVQRFYILSAGKEDQLVEESKFSREWRKKGDTWVLERELDYMVNTKFGSQPTKSNTLYNEIAHMDSLLFNAYNNRDIETVKVLFDKSLEFYHDKGGLSGYAETIAGLTATFKQNNGIRRDLVAGSLEVYPINNYGAVQVGLHTFCHPENGRQDCGTFKFMHVWQKKDGQWKITRVVSYDH